MLDSITACFGFSMFHARSKNLLHRTLGVALLFVFPTTASISHGSTWDGGSGNWSSDGTPGWHGTNVPNGVGAVAENPITTTGTTIQDIAASVTVGTIELSGSGSFEWTITNSNGIIVDSGGSGATIRNSNASTAGMLDILGGTITLADDLLIENTSNSNLIGVNNGAIRITSVLAGTGGVRFRNHATTYSSDLTNSNYRGAILVFNGPNVSTFRGSVAVEKGLVLYQNPTSFGADDNVITVGSVGGGDAAVLMTGISPAGAHDINYDFIVAAGSGGLLTIGTLSGSASSLPTFTGDILLNDNVRIAAGNEGTTGSTYSGNISGIGGLELAIVTSASPSGYVRFQGINTYMGDTTITSGVFVADSGDAIPNGAGKGDVSIASSGALRINVDETVNGLSGVAGSVVNNRSSVAHTFTIGDNNASSSYAGLIADGAGPLSIAKIGSGTLTLHGNNSYSGTTVVNGGTLFVNGSHIGGDNYSINNNASLAGDGSITTSGNSGVTIGSGGKLAPGSSVGTLTLNLGTGQLNLTGALSSPNPSMFFELAAIDNHDQVKLANPASKLNIGDGVLEFADFTFSHLSGFGAGTYTLFDTSNTIVGSLGNKRAGVIGEYSATLSLANDNQDVVLSVETSPRLLIDRQTGAATLIGAPDKAVGLYGYTISSSLGALAPDGWKPISGNYDTASNGGQGNIDDDDAWTILSPSNQHIDLSEAALTGGDGGELGASQAFDLGNSLWIRNAKEDVQMQMLFTNGMVKPVPVEFVGGTGQPHQRSDLNFDADLDRDDWLIFNAGSSTNLAGLSPAEAYQVGDLNYDGMLNSMDLILFMVDFDALNGFGAFQQMINILPGDYNNDKSVDAADYVTWRKRLGADSLLNETVSLGIVDEQDYGEWRKHFGMGGAAGIVQNSVSVPEPRCSVLVSVVLVVCELCYRSRRKQRRAH